MELTKEAVKHCRCVGALRDFLCQAMDQIDEKDKEIAELKAKIEEVQSTAYTDSVDAGMRERKLKRALYKAIINWSKVTRLWDGSKPADDYDKWYNVERKCLAKAEKYK